MVAGDYIHALAADGVIGGGTILCRNMVAAANIGFTKGARTKFIVGVDHRVIRRTKIREKRLQNLIEAQERYKLEFRELTQKKDSQLTLKHKQLKESLKEKMTNVRPLIETVTQQLEILKTSMTYNEDALIAATNVFAANCQVEVGGQGVVLEADTMAVGISARKRRDSHLCTYDEIKSEIERKLAGSPVSEAPATAAQAATVPSETSQQPAPAPETGAQAEVAAEPSQTAEVTTAGDHQSPAQVTAENTVTSSEPTVEASQTDSTVETDTAAVDEPASQVAAEQTEEADPVVQESAPKAS